MSPSSAGRSAGSGPAIRPSRPIDGHPQRTRPIRVRVRDESDRGRRNGQPAGDRVRRLLWGELTHGRVLGVLKNQCYAGTYVFGRYHYH